MDERSARPRKKIELVKNTDGEGPRNAVVSGVTTQQPAASTESVPGIAPGLLLDGKYLIGPIVGSGAFGLVFEGKNLELDEKVAIKTLRPEMSADSAMVARFAREAKSAAAIKSEYVCSVYDVGVTENVPYIVMEYLEGRDLGTVIAESGALGPRTAVEYALQICEALAVAHAKGIVHRDIKPENLLLTERAGGMRIIKVLDFGISKTALTGSIFGEEMPIVKTINLMGTPLYMSPEQVRSSGGVDVRSDIWSLGMVLYEILAAATAFEGNSITEICAAILEARPKPIELHRGDLPSGLVEVIARCLEKDVKLRYQNVGELALALMPFGPKRSRLNVERAVTILQSAGQFDPNVQIDSVAPPPSSDISSSPLLPRPSKVGFDLMSPAGASSSGGTSGGPAAATPALSSAAPVASDDPRASAMIAPLSKKKPVMILAGLAVVAGLAGGVFFLSGALNTTSKTETKAEPTVSPPTPSPTTTSPTEAARAQTPPAPMADAPPATHPAAPTATEPATAKAASTTVVRPPPAGVGVPNYGGVHRTKAGATATPPPPVAPPSTAGSAPSPPPPAATPTETGRTFRREL